MILVVDDDALLRRVLVRAVTSLGHPVRTASSAEEALVLCREQLPTLLLVDEQMPEMRGHQLIRVLRDELGDRCPTLVLATGGDEDVSNAGDIDAFLPKPFSVDDLRLLLDRLGRP